MKLAKKYVTQADIKSNKGQTPFINETYYLKEKGGGGKRLFCERNRF